MRRRRAPAVRRPAADDPQPSPKTSRPSEKSGASPLAPSPAAASLRSNGSSSGLPISSSGPFLKTIKEAPPSSSVRMWTARLPPPQTGGAMRGQALAIAEEEPCELRSGLPSKRKGGTNAAPSEAKRKSRDPNRMLAFRSKIQRRPKEEQPKDAPTPASAAPATAAPPPPVPRRGGSDKIAAAAVAAAAAAAAAAADTHCTGDPSDTAARAAAAFAASATSSIFNSCGTPDGATSLSWSAGSAAPAAASTTACTCAASTSLARGSAVDEQSRGGSGQPSLGAAAASTAAAPRDRDSTATSASGSGEGRAANEGCGEQSDVQRLQPRGRESTRSPTRVPKDGGDARLAVSPPPQHGESQRVTAAAAVLASEHRTARERRTAAAAAHAAAIEAEKIASRRPPPVEQHRSSHSISPPRHVGHSVNSVAARAVEEHNHRMLMHAHAHSHHGHHHHGGAQHSLSPPPGRGEIKSFSALRAAADAHVAMKTAGGQHHHMGVGGGGHGMGHDASPSMLEHERGLEEARMRRAKARAEFLMQRAEEEQTRAEVYALNRLMRRREIMRFEAYVKARKLSRKRARAMRLVTEATGDGAEAAGDEARAVVHSLTPASPPPDDDIPTEVMATVDDLILRVECASRDEELARITAEVTDVIEDLLSAVVSRSTEDSHRLRASGASAMAPSSSLPRASPAAVPPSVPHATPLPTKSRLPMPPPVPVPVPMSASVPPTVPTSLAVASFSSSSANADLQAAPPEPSDPAESSWPTKLLPDVKPRPPLPSTSESQQQAVRVDPQVAIGLPQRGSLAAGPVPTAVPVITAGTQEEVPSLARASGPARRSFCDIPDIDAPYVGARVRGAVDQSGRVDPSLIGWRMPNPEGGNKLSTTDFSPRPRSRPAAAVRKHVAAHDTLDTTAGDGIALPPSSHSPPAAEQSRATSNGNVDRVQSSIYLTKASSTPVGMAAAPCAMAPEATSWTCSDHGPGHLGRGELLASSICDAVGSSEALEDPPPAPRSGTPIGDSVSSLAPMIGRVDSIHSLGLTSASTSTNSLPSLDPPAFDDSAASSLAASTNSLPCIAVDELEAMSFTNPTLPEADVAVMSPGGGVKRGDGDLAGSSSSVLRPATGGGTTEPPNASLAKLAFLSATVPVGAGSPTIGSAGRSVPHGCVLRDFAPRDTMDAPATSGQKAAVPVAWGERPDAESSLWGTKGAPWGELFPNTFAEPVASEADTPALSKGYRALDESSTDTTYSGDATSGSASSCSTNASSAVNSPHGVTSSGSCPAPSSGCGGAAAASTSTSATPLTSALAFSLPKNMVTAAFGEALLSTSRQVASVQHKYRQGTMSARERAGTGVVSSVSPAAAACPGFSHSVEQTGPRDMPSSTTAVGGVAGASAGWAQSGSQPSTGGSNYTVPGPGVDRHHGPQQQTPGARHTSPVMRSPQHPAQQLPFHPPPGIPALPPTVLGTGTPTPKGSMGLHCGSSSACSVGLEAAHSVVGATQSPHRHISASPAVRAMATPPSDAVSPRSKVGGGGRSASHAHAKGSPRAACPSPKMACAGGSARMSSRGAGGASPRSPRGGQAGTAASPRGGAGASSPRGTPSARTVPNPAAVGVPMWGGPGEIAPIQLEGDLEAVAIEAATKAALMATASGQTPEAAQLAAEEAAAVAIGTAAVKAVLSRVTKAAERAAQLSAAKVAAQVATTKTFDKPTLGGEWAGAAGSWTGAAGGLVGGGLARCELSSKINASTLQAGNSSKLAAGAEKAASTLACGGGWNAEVKSEPRSTASLAAQPGHGALAMPGSAIPAAAGAQPRAGTESGGLLRAAPPHGAAQQPMSRVPADQEAMSSTKRSVPRAEKAESTGTAATAPAKGSSSAHKAPWQGMLKRQELASRIADGGTTTVHSSLAHAASGDGVSGEGAAEHGVGSAGSMHPTEVACKGHSAVSSVPFARDGPGREGRLTHAMPPGQHHAAPSGVPGSASHPCNEAFSRSANGSESSARAEPPQGSSMRTSTRESSLKHNRLQPEHHGSGSNSSSSSSVGGRAGRWSQIPSGRSDASHDVSARPHGHGAAGQKPLETKGMVSVRGAGGTMGTGGNGRRRAGGQGGVAGGQRRNGSTAESRSTELRAERLERAERAAAASSMHGEGGPASTPPAAHRSLR